MLENIFDRLSWVIDYILAGLVRTIGPLFALGVVIFDTLILISFYTITLPFLIKETSLSIAINLSIIITYLYLNLQLNFSLALLIKPGSIGDIINSKSNNRQRDSDIMVELSELVSNEDNDLLRNIQENKEIQSLPHCNKCNIIKLLRSHHCTVCNQCVIKMDHHCPWINNCIGLNNHRYFLLFLFYAQLYLQFAMITSLHVALNEDPSANQHLFQVSIIINLLSLFMTSFFNIWQWILVLKGYTTVEYWINKTKRNNHDIIKDFSFKHWQKNLKIVFGTESILKALFIPSIKLLPLIGLEWTLLAFHDFNIYKTD